MGLGCYGYGIALPGGLDLVVFLVFACCDFAMVSYGGFWYWLGSCG